MNASGIWRRSFASILDGVFILSIYALIGLVLEVMRYLLKIEFSMHVIILKLIPIISYLYYIILESYAKQASLGKRAMNIKVVTSKEKKPSFTNIVIRTLLWSGPSIFLYTYSYLVFMSVNTIFESIFNSKWIFEFLLILSMIWWLPVFSGKRTIYYKLTIKLLLARLLWH